MNDLKKGFFTVVVATIITSGVILMTGKSIADSTNDQLLEASSLESKNSVQASQSNVVNVTSEDTVNAAHQSPPPPPGPYLHLHSKNNDGFDKLKTLASPVAPEVPTNLANKKNTVPDKPQINVAEPVMKHLPKVNLDSLQQVDEKIITKPELTISEPKAPSISSVTPLVKIESTKSSLEAPKLPQLSLTAPSKSSDVPMQKIQVTKPPVAPQNSSKQPVLMNNGKPIWMQQNADINQGITSQKRQYIQQQALKNNMGNHNFLGTNGIQQYRYVPMPVYPSYYYPQMPINNNVSMPNYWMPSMAPKNPSIGQSPAGLSFSQPLNKSSN